MKFSEITHIDIKELWTRLSKLRKELFNSRMKLKMQRLSNPLVIRFLRRDIARINHAITLKKTHTKQNKSKGDSK